MIHATEVNHQLVAENAALRLALEALGNSPSVDPSTKALIAVVAAGFTAIHERQGLALALSLQTSGG